MWEDAESNLDAADQIDPDNPRENMRRWQEKRNLRELLERERVKEEARLKRHASPYPS